MSASNIQSPASMTPSRTPNVVGKRAVMYLRVSTRGQVNTDYDPEGISIPAQRLACQRKAEQLGLTLIEEYTELGQSATETTKRTAFNRMLARIRTERDVDYVIVYKLSRFARNRIDDAMTMAELQKRNVQLVSATEQIDATPVGQLMHGILSAFNEFRSREDGADIAYKMGQKAKNGGTLGKAPLGYLNTIERIDGRDIRAVSIDEERAPFVRKAFELYATGEYSMEDIIFELTDLGLTTRSTRLHEAGPVSTSKMSRLLRDRYYLGDIVYKGDTFKGRHEALLSHSLFEKVQLLLEGSEKAGERKRIYHHYLKGSLYCSHCQDERGEVSRLLLQRTLGRHGDEYFYYFCRSRQHGGPCRSSRHLAISGVEDTVLDYYRSLSLDPGFTAHLRAWVDMTIQDQQTVQRQLRTALQVEAKDLLDRIDNLLDLAAEGGIAASRAKQKIRDLEHRKQAADQRMAEVGNDMSDAAACLISWIELVEKAPSLYAHADDESRRRLNQAIFKRIYLSDHGVTGSELQPEVDLIMGTHQLWAADQLRAEEDTRSATNEKDASALAPLSLEDLLDVDLAQVSSKAYMVPPTGLEPAT